MACPHNIKYVLNMCNSWNISISNSSVSKSSQSDSLSANARFNVITTNQSRIGATFQSVIAVILLIIVVTAFAFLAADVDFTVADTWLNGRNRSVWFKWTKGAKSDEFWFSITGSGCQPAGHVLVSGFLSFVWRVEMWPLFYTFDHLLVLTFEFRKLLKMS